MFLLKNPIRNLEHLTWSLFVLCIGRNIKLECWFSTNFVFWACWPKFDTCCNTLTKLLQVESIPKIISFNLKIISFHSRERNLHMAVWNLWYLSLQDDQRKVKKWSCFSLAVRRNWNCVRLCKPFRIDKPMSRNNYFLFFRIALYSARRGI
jgi:hypothetical protein